MVRLVSLAFMLVATPGRVLAQGVPVNDSGLTARDLVETADGRRMRRGLQMVRP